MADDSSNNERRRASLRVVTSEHQKPSAAAERPSSEVGAAPLMIRDLEGRILYWNGPAEQSYGWSQRDALGNVSHALLHTVFPQPLDIINYELLNRGVWKGELIHTRADGARVKVQSTWELSRDAAGRLCTVLEVNQNFAFLEPSNAHLASSREGLLKRIVLRIRDSWWLLIPVLLLGIGLGLILHITHSESVPLIP